MIFVYDPKLRRARSSGFNEEFLQAIFDEAISPDYIYFFADLDTSNYGPTPEKPEVYPHEHRWVTIETKFIGEGLYRRVHRKLGCLFCDATAIG